MAPTFSVWIGLTGRRVFHGTYATKRRAFEALYAWLDLRQRTALTLGDDKAANDAGRQRCEMASAMFKGGLMYRRTAPRRHVVYSGVLGGVRKDA